MPDTPGAEPSDLLQGRFWRMRLKLVNTGKRNDSGSTLCRNMVMSTRLRGSSRPSSLLIWLAISSRGRRIVVNASTSNELSQSSQSSRLGSHRFGRTRDGCATFRAGRSVELSEAVSMPLCNLNLNVKHGLAFPPRRRPPPHLLSPLPKGCVLALAHIKESTISCFQTRILAGSLRLSCPASVD